MLQGDNIGLYRDNGKEHGKYDLGLRDVAGGVGIVCLVFSGVFCCFGQLLGWWGWRWGGDNSKHILAMLHVLVSCRCSCGCCCHAIDFT